MARVTWQAFAICCHTGAVPDPAQAPPPPDDHRRRRGGGGGAVHGVAGVLPPAAGQPRHPRARAGGRRGARLRPQPGRPGARVRAHEDRRAAGPGHHQPLLRRGDQGRRARRRRGRADPAARRHPGEPGRRGAADPPPRRGRRRLRAERLPAARGRAAPGRRAQPDHAGQPGRRPGCRLRGGRLRHRHPADRRPPGVVRPPVAGLRRRPARVVVRAPGAGPGCAPRPRRAGWSAQRFGPYSPTVAGGPAAADAVLASGATAVVCHNDMLAIGADGPARRARQGRARATSAWSASTTSSAPTSATRR